MNYSLNSQSLILCWTLNRQVRLEPGKGSVRVGIRPSGGSPECLGLVQTISFTNQGSGGGVLGREPGGSDSGPGGTVGKASIRLMSGDMGALNSRGGALVAVAEEVAARPTWALASLFPERHWARTEGM
jgi:hypothetical protein